MYWLLVQLGKKDGQIHLPWAGEHHSSTLMLSSTIMAHLAWGWRSSCSSSAWSLRASNVDFSFNSNPDTWLSLFFNKVPFSRTHKKVFSRGGPVGCEFLRWAFCWFCLLAALCSVCWACSRPTGWAPKASYPEVALLHSWGTCCESGAEFSSCQDLDCSLYPPAENGSAEGHQCQGGARGGTPCFSMKYLWSVFNILELYGVVPLYCCLFVLGSALFSEVLLGYLCWWSLLLLY